MRPYPTLEGRPLVLAHRGASADAPENTLAAFLEALRQRADGVELDVMRCASGEVVVCHDEWLDRLAGRHLEVLRTPWSELSRLDLGRRFSEAFVGERMPLLTEVLDLLPQGTVLNVELKCDTARDHGLTRETLRLLDRDGDRHEVVVSSFNPLCVARVRALSPKTRTALLFESTQPLPLRTGMLAPVLQTGAVHPEHVLCTAESVARWKARGFAVGTWTVDREADVERLCRAGVDALITNRPAAVRAMVARFAAPAA